MHDNKPIKRAFQGAFAAFGAPLGWLVIRLSNGAELYPELHLNTGLYLYMTFGTLIAFSAFGWFVGNKERLVALLALRDALTGLFNVRYFREQLDAEVLIAQRYETPLTLIMFDLDHFKRVNDEYGHPIGDEVLVAVSEATTHVLRKYDVLARVGGEEFVALLPRCSIDVSEELAERLRKKIESLEVEVAKGKTISVTVSIGIAELENADRAKEIYKKVDMALYQAKESGRNKTVVYKE